MRAVSEPIREVGGNSTSIGENRRTALLKRGIPDFPYGYLVELSLACAGLIVFSMIFAGQGSAGIDKSSVVGIWCFDEIDGNTVEDASGNGHHGEIKGSLKLVDGKFGKALEFDGSSYMEVPDAEGLRLTGAMTMMAWVYPAQNPMPANSGVIVKYKVAGNMRGYDLDFGDSARVCLSSDGTFVEGVTGTCVGTTNWKAEEWDHVAAVYDGKTVSFYLNGTLEAKNDFDKGINPTTAPLDIGRGSAGMAFEGVIDEVAIFNKALTADDIQRVMTRGLLAGMAVFPAGKLAITWGSIKE